jgi:hypothetical protein
MRKRDLKLNGFYLQEKQQKVRYIERFDDINAYYHVFEASNGKLWEIDSACSKEHFARVSDRELAPEESVKMDLVAVAGWRERKGKRLMTLLGFDE